jgi:hypothetical protein
MPVTVLCNITIFSVLCDSSLPPRFKRDLSFYETLRGVDWYLVTDVMRQRFGPFLKGHILACMYVGLFSFVLYKPCSFRGEITKS